MKKLVGLIAALACILGMTGCQKTVKRFHCVRISRTDHADRRLFLLPRELSGPLSSDRKNMILTTYILCL